MLTKLKLKNYFKLEGFNLEPQALARIQDLFSRIEEDKHEVALSRIINSILQQNLRNNNITLAILEKVCNVSKTDNSAIKFFQLINIREMPELVFNTVSKKYVKKDTKKLNLFRKIVTNIGQDRMNLLLNRYRIILHRLLRNKRFVIDEFHNIDANVTHLRSIMRIISSGMRSQKAVVLGILGQFEGNWILEDDGSTVNLNIDSAVYHKGLVIEGSVVLVEGEYRDQTFYVSAIGMPAIESQVKSREAIDKSFNYFGGLPVDESVKTNLKLDKYSRTEFSGKTLIILSEIWLDKEESIGKFKTLFSGHVDLKPVAFILIGNFLSPETYNYHVNEKMRLVKAGIKQIASSYASFPKLALNGHLIFVPGPNDPYPGLLNMLPRPEFPQEFIADSIRTATGYSDNERIELTSRILLASNPCRITVYNKEIVVFRDDICDKLYRHCLYIPPNCTGAEEGNSQSMSQNADDSQQLNDSAMMDDSAMIHDSQNLNRQDKNSLEYHLVYTLLAESHLLPLPIHVSPVGWNLDHTLSLFPAPDFVILADPSSKPFSHNIAKTHFINPPPFSKDPLDNLYPFNMLLPYSGDVQHCCMNN